MEVIHFPGAAKLNKKTTKLKRESSLATPQDQLITSDATYTCPNCHNNTSFSFNGIIVRTLDFYCAQCGTRHRVVNPAFSPTSRK